MVLRIGDPAWLTTRLEKLVAYCQGYRRLRDGDGESGRLLDRVDAAGYDAVNSKTRTPERPLEECEMSEASIAYHREKLDVIMDSICSECMNHCSRCVYDCQIRYDEECVLRYEERLWDEHRALAQVMTASVIVQRDVETPRAKVPKKSLRKKSKMVIGGEKMTDPVWPSVLLTFDRGISSSFRETWRGCS